MAPRKSPGRVLNPDEDDVATSAPLLPDSAALLTRRDAAKARHVSLKQCAVLLNRDRNTITKYLENGCPSVDKADRERGVAWVLDIADVVRWLEDRAAKNVSERMGAGKDGQIDEAEAKRRRAVAQAYTAELEYAESSKIVARIADMLDLVRTDYSELSLRLKAIPDAIAAKVEAKLSEKVRSTAHELIDSALGGMAAADKIEKIASGG